MLDIEYIAKSLDPEKSRKSGEGWMVRCPCHDDSSPSLHIQQGEHTEILAHCFAGCTYKDIYAELERRGLYKYVPSSDSHQNWQRGSEQDRFREEFKRAYREENQLKHFRPVGDFCTYAQQLPPPDFICGPFQTHSSGFIAAPGGSGKSMFTLGLAQALAEGAEFAGWKTPEPRGVHIVDVEMSDPGLFSRMHSLGYYAGLDITVDTSDQRDALDMPRFRLGPDESHNQLMEDASEADVIIIDNVSACLTPERSGDLFSPETWQQVFPLEAWARREGKCLIFVDHTNKGGQLAGSLHKHRMADFVCLMERTSLIGEPWLEFLFWMDKCRYDAPAEDVMARLVRLEDGEWTHSDPDAADDVILHEVILGNLSQKEAAEEMGVHRNTLEKRLKKYRRKLRVQQRERE